MHPQPGTHRCLMVFQMPQECRRPPVLSRARVRLGLVFLFFSLSLTAFERAEVGFLGTRSQVGQTRSTPL